MRFLYIIQSTSTAATTNKDEVDVGGSPLAVQLKSHRDGANLHAATPTVKKASDSTPEFSKFKLRKTDNSFEKPKKVETNTSSGFGVTLKVNTPSLNSFGKVVCSMYVVD